MSREDHLMSLTLTFYIVDVALNKIAVTLCLFGTGDFRYFICPLINGVLRYIMEPIGDFDSIGLWP
jgi:hypothetical protein